MKLTKSTYLKVKSQARNEALDGQFALRSGNATKTKPVFPIFKSSLITQNKFTHYTPAGIPTSVVYMETMETPFFGRTEDATKSILYFGTEGQNFGGISGLFDGFINIDMDINGVIVGGDDGNVGESFIANLKTTFKIKKSSVTMTQLGTAGGILTSVTKDANVGTQTIYVAQNTTLNASVRDRSTYGTINFMISNTGNKIIEWSGTAKFKAYKTKLYQSNGSSGGALYQNITNIQLQNGDGLLWN